MAEPVKNVTLGGLTYNVNQVKKAKDNGDGTFTISFKTGETLTYPEQSVLRLRPEAEQTDGRMLPDPMHPGATYNSGVFDRVEPRVNQNISEGWIYDDVTFDISDVMGATFTSHKDNVSYVNLNNSVDCTIDLAANNSKQYGDFANIQGGKNNEVILDKKDNMIYTTSNGGTSANVSGPGIQAQE